MNKSMKKDSTGVWQGAFLVVLILVVQFASVLEADAWWNDEWQYRKKVAFHAPPADAESREDLKEIPVLIRLHTGNFDFANAGLEGEDLRIVSGDDMTLLTYHIEKFDSLEETAFVWVKMPRLTGNSGQDFIWMYYGNQFALDAQDPGGTYDGNYVAVYHFNETEGVPGDETLNKNNSYDFTGWQGMPAVIGNGITFNGVTDEMVIPALNLSEGFTFSAWVRIGNPLNDAYIFSTEDEEQGLLIGIDQERVYCRIISGMDQPLMTEVNADLPLNHWTHLTVTAVPNGRMVLYVDGSEAASVDLPEKMPTLSNAPVIGSSRMGGHMFSGELDEVRISNVGRSPAWVKSCYEAQGPEGILGPLGLEEISEGGNGASTSYLSTIAGNITLDGWLVIGILMVLSAWSWVVFITKTLSLSMVEKENRAFVSSFTKQAEPFDFRGNEDDFRNSVLYRVYALGAGVVKQALEKEGAIKEEMDICPKTIAAFKAELEKGFLEQSRKLNSSLLVLTLAISGGPFLGLLGTVWGVMNTFAAMAEAGEANIMAIAPGVASALSTTVIGLVVAIPALFGYNYLIGKIKNITADLTVFINQYALRVDNRYGGSS